ETRELRFRAAATAVARYRLGQTDLVLGGGWTTLPYADAIDAPDSELALDPVEGLFGLAVVSNSGFLGDAAGREVLSLAIDRSQLAELFGRQRSEARNAIIPESVE